MNNNTAGFAIIAVICLSIASCGIASQWRLVEMAKIQAKLEARQP